MDAVGRKGPESPFVSTSDWLEEGAAGWARVFEKLLRRLPKGIKKLRMREPEVRGCGCTCSATPKAKQYKEIPSM